MRMYIAWGNGTIPPATDLERKVSMRQEKEGEAGGGTVGMGWRDWKSGHLHCLDTRAPYHPLKDGTLKRGWKRRRGEAGGGWGRDSRNGVDEKEEGCTEAAWRHGGSRRGGRVAGNGLVRGRRAGGKEAGGKGAVKRGVGERGREKKAGTAKRGYNLRREGKEL